MKNIRKSASRRVANIGKKKKLKAAIKKIKKMTSKTKALKIYPEVQSLIDKSIQDCIITKNIASRYKSRLLEHIKSLK